MDELRQEALTRVTPPCRWVVAGGSRKSSTHEAGMEADFAVVNQAAWLERLAKGERAIKAS
ncbi:hypothetical protein CRG98_016118 [Punica granatum]|uniref:Uncharacterized protein n=1 Tax=Punica granatum TaxID=22663 RepID=A0A2I0K4I0_PUNGR|nr:hypothetical protein CRG98_016118 [Punica granatum]